MTRKHKKPVGYPAGTAQAAEVPPGFSIGEHMEVVASCGTRVGKVEKVEGTSLKLTKNDSQAGGKHHYIPLAWVQRVDQQVHLNKDSEDVMRDWQGEPVGTTTDAGRS